jgi:hypothetical protein
MKCTKKANLRDRGSLWLPRPGGGGKWRAVMVTLIDKENVLKFIVLMVAQVYEYVKAIEAHTSNG